MRTIAVALAAWLLAAGETRAQLAAGAGPDTPAGTVASRATGMLPADGAPGCCPDPAEASVPRFGAEVSYLLWWIKNGPLPGPMITLGATQDARPGALGQPGTVPLAGSSSLDYKLHSGGLLTLDYWSDDQQRFGVEAVGLILETHTIHVWADSNHAGSPVIARPFFDTLTGQESARLISAPGKALGGIDLFSDSRLWGGEANLLAGIYRGPCMRLDGLAGFRYLGMDESLRFSQSSTLFRPGYGFFGTPVPAPDIVSITDRFETRNEFFGGQIGARGKLCWHRWQLDLLGKAGIGATHQWVNNQGGTSRTGPDGAIYPGPGGILALNSNMGLSGREQFGFVGEVGVGVGYQCCSWLSVRVGYDFLYWSAVARPGDEIDRSLNPRQLPSSPLYGSPVVPLEPARFFHSSDFWAQGLTFSLAVTF